MSKVTAKNRIIIAAMLFGVLIIGALISIVLVFAAQTQNVTTSISISYLVDGVGADVGFRYAMIPTDEAEDQTITPISQMTSGFGVSEEERQQSLGGIAEGTLAFSSNSRQIVFEYYFKNTAESAFSINMIGSPYLESQKSGSNNPTNNMEERYYVSAEPLRADQWGEKLIKEGQSTENFAPQALTEIDSDMYIYVSANVENPNKGANYEGDFVWELNQQETINITLNDNGTERTLRVIPDSIVPGIMLPCIKVPKLEGSAYLGYFAETNSITNPYIDINGTGMKAASEVSTTTILYSSWVEGMTISGSTLTEVNEDVVEANSGVLTIPDGVTVVGSGEDYQAVSTTATEIVIPNSVEVINDYAFYYNENLTTVIFEENTEAQRYADSYSTSGSRLKVIGENAFMCCGNLTSILIPEDIKEIEDGAFDSCFSMSEIYLESLESWLKLSFGNDFSHRGNHPFHYSTPFEGKYYLNGDEITELEIPSNITEIPAYAFQFGTTISSIIIPSRVTSIGNSAFESLYSMSEIHLESLESWLNIDFIGDNESPRSRNPFECTSSTTCKYYLKGEEIIELEIPDGVKEIPAVAFYKGNRITNVTFPSSVTRIGYSAFDGCSSLISVTIPSSVTSIGSSAFSGCSSLSNLTIPDGVTAIESLSFSGCRNLISITIPSSVTSIGSFAFSNCISLARLEILSNNITIGSDAFRYCSSLARLEILSSNITIGSDAFYECYSLVQIRNLSGRDLTDYGYEKPTFAENEITTPDGQFVGTLEIGEKYTIYTNGTEKVLLSANKNITEANDIPSGITQINKYAFYSCSSLSSIIIPGSVTSIGDHAFDNCSSLSSIIIPSSVTSIGSFAFSDCSSLTSVEFKTTSGWFVSYSSTATSGTNVTLSATDFASNATLLNTTHRVKYWKRSA